MEWFIVNYASLNSVPQESNKPVSVASVLSLFLKITLCNSALSVPLCATTLRDGIGLKREVL